MAWSQSGRAGGLQKRPEGAGIVRGLDYCRSCFSRSRPLLLDQSYRRFLGARGAAPALRSCAGRSTAEQRLLPRRTAHRGRPAADCWQSAAGFRLAQQGPAREPELAPVLLPRASPQQEAEVAPVLLPSSLRRLEVAVLARPLLPSRWVQAQPRRSLW